MPLRLRFRRRPLRSIKGRKRPGFTPAEVLEDRTLLTAYVVDTLDDAVAADGRVSLREAVLAANGNAAVNDAAAGQGGGVTDTVTFAASVAGGTVTLAGSELAVTGDLAIYGPATVSGGNTTRVFSVAAGASVALAGLTVTGGGGRADDPDPAVAEGAGVYNAGTLLLAGCVFKDNRAGSAGGAVINAVGAALTVSDCAFTGNAAGVHGAAVFNNGALVMSGGLLSGNGGPSEALYNAGTASVAGSVVYGNGGAGVGNAGVMAIDGGSVSGNARAAIDNAGALTLSGVAVAVNAGGVSNDGSLRVVGGSITGNGDTGLENHGRADVYGVVISGNGRADRANSGGGVLNSGGVREAVLVLRDSVVSQNVAAAGGGIFNAGFSMATVVGCLIAGNAAETPAQSGQVPGARNGGGAFNAGTLTILNSVVARNSAAVGGGGVYTTGGSLVVADSVVAQNTAGRGGGVAVGPNPQLVIDTVPPPPGATTGGATPGSAVITRSTLAFNTAADGGGISNEWVLEVYDSTLSGNYASQNGGGLRDTQLSALYNVTVFGNRAGAAGGGVYFASGEFPHPAGRTGTKLVNTIVAGNRRGSAGTEGTPDDVTGAPASGSEHDLIGDAATAGGLTDGANGNIVGVDWRDVLDPVLRDNGGPTPTHALFGGSRAFEGGTESSPLATDQRGVGFPRKVGRAVDIGAVEFLPIALPADGGGALRAPSDDSLAAFWAQADEDEAFGAGLTAAG
jgi:hypothetical protein